MRSTSHLLTITGLPASATLTRGSFAGGLIPCGELLSLELDFSLIVGATSVNKLTLTWVDADRRYLANAETSGLTINVDQDDAALGSYELNVGKKFKIPSDATGMYLGVQLDAGTATVNAFLNIRDHG